MAEKVKLVIEIPKYYLDHPQDYSCLAECVRRGTLIPKNATNGDMIKAMFPNIDCTEMTMTVHATAKVTSNGVKGGISYDFWKEWWNAPYMVEIEEREQNGR